MGWGLVPECAHLIHESLELRQVDLSKLKLQFAPSHLCKDSMSEVFCILIFDFHKIVEGLYPQPTGRMSAQNSLGIIPIRIFVENLVDQILPHY